MVCPRRKLLNRCYVILWVLLCSISFAEDLRHAKVIGDRVNVRVRPEVNSEVVTQLSSGEDVVILESNDEWVKIKAPDHSKCWVNNECIDGTTVKKDLTNLRCGPGMAFPVLVRLENGTKVNIIEVFGEWTRIKPPVEFGVWVNSKYVECEKPKEEPVKEETAEEQIVKAPIVEEKPLIVSVPEKEIAGIELVSYAGKLEDLGMIINRPGTYKLVSEASKWICIIKSSTLDLNPYANRIVRIEGVVLAKSSSWDVPVIEAKRLQVVK